VHIWAGTLLELLIKATSLSLGFRFESEDSMKAQVYRGSRDVRVTNFQTLKIENQPASG